MRAAAFEGQKALGEAQIKSSAVGSFASLVLVQENLLENPGTSVIQIWRCPVGAQFLFGFFLLAPRWVHDKRFCKMAAAAALCSTHLNHPGLGPISLSHGSLLRHD